MDGAGGPGGGFGYEALEEGFGGGADVVAALGVPLDAEDEVGVGVGGVLAAFDGFDDGVLGAAGGDAEAVAGDADGLVVAGVDGETEESVLFGGFFGGMMVPRRESGAMAAVWATATVRPAGWLTGMGARSWTRVPPRQTLRDWVPKQMARMGL